MSAGASLANWLWLASGRHAATRFTSALGDPARAQGAWLRRQMRMHRGSEFGERHAFGAMRTVADFTRQVPMCSYDDLAPFIARIRSGARDVLSVGPVTHLAPTSGSTGARKLIPFSASLQRGFSAAVSAWMHDLVRQRPAVRGGPAYWSVSPLADEEEIQPSRASDAIRIGFADDADYLGSGAASLVRQALAVPAAVRHVRETRAFWNLTLLALLRHRDLRLISIWHPSFLDLMLAAAGESWSELLDAVAHGDSPWSHALPPSARRWWRSTPDRTRALELRRLGPEGWTRWWPQLCVVSCWGEQGAEAGWRRVAQRLPDVLVQPKGLLATEAVVTIPFRATHVLAITSHFFEFLDERGDLRLAHELRRGERYEVVVSNGGGLWRYRLGDVVECTGHLEDTPTLRFLGRAGHVSDLRGEKLSEAFVADTLRAVWQLEGAPAYSALRAWSDGERAGYELLVSPEVAGDAAERAARRLDDALRANPHYALARRLRQLDAVRVARVALEQLLAELRSRPGRLGDAKPQVLLMRSG